MALEREIAYFEGHRSELAGKYRHLFVLIKGDEVLGAFPSAEEAYNDGVRRFGIEPFLVKQAVEVEPVATIPVFSVGLSRARL